MENKNKIIIISIIIVLITIIGVTIAIVNKKIIKGFSNESSNTQNIYENTKREPQDPIDDLSLIHI